jgi:hypothetical protein
VTALRMARAVLLAVMTAVMALAQLHLPSERFWEQHQLAQWISVGLLVLFTVGEAAASAIALVEQAEEWDWADSFPWPTRECTWVASGSKPCVPNTAGNSSCSTESAHWVNQSRGCWPSPCIGGAPRCHAAARGRRARRIPSTCG